MTKTTIETSDDALDELLSCGLEGGISYWAHVLNIRLTPADDPDQSLAMAVIRGNAKLTIEDKEEEGKIYILDSSVLQNGLRLFTELCPMQWAEWRRGECDANCGDCFVQCCLFGQVHYA